MKYGKITVDPAISSEIGTALTLIEATDPKLYAQMLNTEWELQSCDAGGNGHPMGCLSLFVSGVVMGTRPSVKITVVSFEALHQDADPLHIRFDHMLTAALIHEWVHLFQDDLLGEELTPMQCSEQFAEKLSDEALVRWAKSMLKGIEPNGEWNTTRVHDAVATEFGIPE